VTSAAIARCTFFALKVLNDIPSPIGYIVLCAGIVCGARRITGDGIEETLQVNALSQALLLDLLLPKLESSGRHARVVFVASSLHRQAAKEHDLSPSSLNEVFGTPNWKSMTAYALSKLLFMHLFFIARDRIKKRNDGTTVIAVSPGFVPNTGLSRESNVAFRIAASYILPMAPFATSLYQGADTILKSIEDTALPSGTYLSKAGVEKAAEECYDEEKRELWRTWLTNQGLWQ